MSGCKVKQIPLEEEYRKKTGISASDIAKLRQWLSTQPHLPAKHITDLDLILMYHSCNRSAEVTKQVIDLHYTVRTHFPLIFKSRSVDNSVMETLDVVLIHALSCRAKDGSAVLYTHLLNYEPKNLYYANFTRVLVMLLDLWQYEEGTWPGFIVVFDLGGMKLGHVGRVELQAVQEILTYFQETMPVKLKSLHFLNAPSFTDKIMMIVRPFMKKALMDSLHVHQSGSTTIEEFVPLEAFPKDVGGTNMTFDECRDYTKKRLQDNSQFFIDENEKRVTESLRPGKAKTISDIFGGVEGSFKKLEID